MPILWGTLDPMQDLPIDPAEAALYQGHAVAVDLLAQVLTCQTPGRAMWLREQINGIVRALEAVENAALDKADRLLEV